MKTTTYIGLGGEPFEVEYDENAPCVMCGLPVGSASSSGTAVCPACDMGKTREGGLYYKGRDYCMECGARVHGWSGTPLTAHPCGHQSKMMWHHPHPFLGPCDCLASRSESEHS